MANGPQDNGSERGVIVEGYIKLWRKFAETSFYKKPNCTHLAIHLLLEANTDDHKTIWNKQEITVRRGELITGRKSLSESTGLSEQQLRTSLDILENVGFLTSKTTNRFTIITICKYNQYQSGATNKSTSKSTNKQPTSNQQATTIEEVKEVLQHQKDNTIKSTSLAESPARELLPHQVFVEKFKAAYKAKTGAEYEATKLDYIHTSGLIKKHGVEAVEQKAGMLARGCEQGLYWFTKDAGWGAFTIGKLCKFWNEIVPVETKEQKEQREIDDCMREQEARRERIASLSR